MASKEQSCHCGSDDQTELGSRTDRGWGRAEHRDRHSLFLSCLLLRRQHGQGPAGWAIGKHPRLQGMETAHVSSLRPAQSCTCGFRLEFSGEYGEQMAFTGLCRTWSGAVHWGTACSRESGSAPLSGAHNSPFLSRGLISCRAE